MKIAAQDNQVGNNNNERSSTQNNNVHATPLQSWPDKMVYSPVAGMTYQLSELTM
jgi:hypothetical protein